MKRLLYGFLFFTLLLTVLSGGLYAWFQVLTPHGPGRDFRFLSGGVPAKAPRFEKTEGIAADPPEQNAGHAAKAESRPAKEPARQSRMPKAQAKRPLAAIIIDDIGDSREMAKKFFALNAPFTYSILPHTRYPAEIANAANRRGYQVMLHLPMEPNGYPAMDPGPGALLTSMTPDERIRQLQLNLNAVPHVDGVNNHMGSKMTAMFDQMNQIFTVLKKRELFFVDSRTTAASQCRSAARLFDLPFAERDVFLDHKLQQKFISRQIEEFIRIAELKGEAIAIGHPHQVTYEVLAEALPKLRHRLSLVPVSRLVKS
ncbi:MAG TPA: divergent polysaccharide deacetylase family protein [Desulfosalsimonadaceae bacterium]|nr:divergent polysaccharide deacetylase family protein [Desulfosalsimonadaceae bacterium]